MGQRGPNTPVDFGVATYTTTAPPDSVFARGKLVTVTHVVYVNVHERPGGTYASLIDHWSLPRP
jgi:hypothetical protein